MTILNFALWAAATVSSPSVYILDYANGKAIARPMAKQLAGFSAASLNAFRRAQNPSLHPGDYCFVEQMRKDALVSPLRKEQEVIDQLFEHAPRASFDISTNSGIRLTVGIYELCQKFSSSEELTGSVLIASKAGKLLWAEEFPGLLPIYLLPPRKNELVIIASCLGCGAVSELYYDAGNGEFYIKYVGD